jgi:hypothetical protein
MQQGQVFELKKRAVDGRAVWAYRYRTAAPASIVTSTTALLLACL